MSGSGSVPSWWQCEAGRALARALACLLTTHLPGAWVLPALPACQCGCLLGHWLAFRPAPQRIWAHARSPPTCTPSAASQAPSGVLLTGLELPYAAPFVPPPSLPPPEHAAGWGDGEGGGTHAGGPWRPARRRALLVGANYARSGERGAALRGCVRDAHCLHGLLSARFGCARSSLDVPGVSRRACGGPCGVYAWPVSLCAGHWGVTVCRTGRACGAVAQ